MKKLRDVVGIFLEKYWFLGSFGVDLGGGVDVTELVEIFE